MQLLLGKENSRNLNTVKNKKITHDGDKENSLKT